MSESTTAPPKAEDVSTIRGTTGATGTAVGSPKTEQFVVTTNAATGDIVSFEFVDVSGQRAEIPDALMRKIAGADELAEIESALDEAFDAGVSMLLEEASDEEAVEDDERLALVRLLLIPLVGRATVRRLKKTRKELFHHLMLRRLIRRYASHQRIPIS